MGVEVLIPDFNGTDAPLRTVMEAGPDILNHNVETVERLQKPVRKRARYDRSLGVLVRPRSSPARSAGATGTVHTKSSLMVGLGETREELSQTFRDLRAVDCDILTIGQYLRPSLQHLPLERYVHPTEFAEMKDEALALGLQARRSRGRWCAPRTTPATRCRRRPRRDAAHARLRLRRTGSSPNVVPARFAGGRAPPGAGPFRWEIRDHVARRGGLGTHRTCRGEAVGELGTGAAASRGGRANSRSNGHPERARSEGRSAGGNRLERDG